MLFVSSHHTIGNSSQRAESAGDSGPGSAAIPPFHCGEGMQLLIHRAADGDSPPAGFDDPGPDVRLVWHCQYGFRLDPRPDPFEEVSAAAARVEACQWELGHALAQLRRAIRTASAKGMPNELLAESAQLSRHEVQMALGPRGR